MCGGNGWLVRDLPKDHPDFGKAIRCFKCADLLSCSRLAPEERVHTVDDMKDRTDDPGREMWVLRFLAKSMLADPYGFLAVYGRKGNAKSLLLTTLVADFCRAGRQGIYFNADDLINRYMDDVTSDQPSEIAHDFFKRIPVLAIDEIDKIKWTAWQIQKIGALIEYRHRNADTLVTLFSMNKPPWQWYNADEVEHIASRFQDGRFNRQWPDDKRHLLPGCLRGNADVPGLFEVTLPDIRPTLRRERHGQPL